jgi:hypothetical protein
VVDHRRTAETVVEGAAELFRKIMKGEKDRQPCLYWHLHDWSRMSDPGILTTARIEMGSFNMPLKDVAGLTPERFLQKRLDDIEAVIGKVRAGLNGKRGSKRAEKPRLRLVGNAVA